MEEIFSVDIFLFDKERLTLLIGKIAIIVVYVLVMLAIGYFCMRKTHNVSDFFLGGRTLGPWMSAFAYGTTYFSAVIFVGYAGRLGWQFGRYVLWIAIGNVIFGSFLAWKLFAARTREMTGRLDALTMPEFLEARFKSPFLKMAAALVIFIFLVPYSASVYQGLSLLFNFNLGMSYQTAIIFMALLTGVYLVMGGYFALALSDFLRGIVELVGVIVMVIFLIHLKGGMHVVSAHLAAHSAFPALGAPVDAAHPFPGWLILASLVIVTSIGPWGMPQMVQKFYSIKSVMDIKRAMIVSTIFCAFIAIGAYFTGAMTHMFYMKAVPGQILPHGISALPANLDDLMPHFLTHYVPGWVSMLILLLVFSASMSSLSSLVLVSSSAIAVDLYAGFKKDVDKRKVMGVMRVLCVVFIGLSLFIALNKIDFIMNLMVISWGALAGAFLAPYLYGLFWKRTTKAGAIAGMISGLATMLGIMQMYAVPGKPNPATAIAGAAAILVPIIVVPLVSLFTPQYDKEHLKKVYGETPIEEAQMPIGK